MASVCLKDVFYDCRLSFNPYQLKHTHVHWLELLSPSSFVEKSLWTDFYGEKNIQCPNIKYVKILHRGTREVKGSIFGIQAAFLEYFLEFLINNIKATLQKYAVLSLVPRYLNHGSIQRIYTERFPLRSLILGPT